MHKFYEDKDAASRAEGYIGKCMGEILDAEKKVFEENRPQIDAAHDGIVNDRTRMLTVQKLIDYLKTQDPNACILAYEQNSDAYIEQFPGLPSPDILTVAEAKKIVFNMINSICFHKLYKSFQTEVNKLQRRLNNHFEEE